MRDIKLTDKEILDYAIAEEGLLFASESDYLEIAHIVTEQINFKLRAIIVKQDNVEPVYQIQISRYVWEDVGSEDIDELKPHIEWRKVFLHPPKDSTEPCDTCKGTGKHFIGFSGSELDGNAPEFEPCPECGHGSTEPASKDSVKRDAEYLALLKRSKALLDVARIGIYEHVANDFFPLKRELEAILSEAKS